MKITSIHVDSPDAVGSRGWCALTLDTDDGCRAIGVVATTDSVAAVRLAEAALVGEDPRAAPALWERLKQISADAGATDGALAALDLAVWDLKARVAGEPLWRTLGAAAPRANCYLRAPGGTAADGLAAALAPGVAQLGVRELLLPAAADPQLDLERLDAARRLLTEQPGEPVLMLAGAGGGDPKQVAQRITWIERQVDLTWIEDPRPGWDVLGLKRISDGIRSAVCSGGSVGPDGFQMLLHHRAADVLQIDLMRTGVTAALRIADAALALEIPVTLAATPGNLGVHIAAVLPNFVSLGLQGDDPLPPGMAGATAVRDGWVTAPADAHGLGFTCRGMEAGR